MCPSSLTGFFSSWSGASNDVEPLVETSDNRADLTFQLPYLPSE